MNFNVLKCILAATLLSTLSSIQPSAAEISNRGGILSDYSDETQSGNVTGRVFADSGEPLVGVMVYIKGTTTGVQTDLDGRYSIRPPFEGETYTLVFQYLGMVTQEIRVKNQRTLNVTLITDNELDGSIIVGAYGTRQKREDLVGSAYQVNAAELKDKPKTRIETMLKGLVPGLDVSNRSDYASTVRGRYDTRIRGDASLNASNEPLWVIDGTPYYTGDRNNMMTGMPSTISPLSFLNPDEIESITILKDADQTTIYGANGSNGVILITTKSGQRNTPLQVFADVQFSVSAPDYSTMVKVMNASQYMEVAKEAWTNSGYTMDNFPFQDNDMNSYSTTSTDWSRLYLGIGDSQNVHLGLTHGTDKASTRTGFSYYRENMSIKGNDTQRFTFNTRNSYHFNKRINLDAALDAAYIINNVFDLAHSYLETLPIIDPYYENGSYRLHYKTIENGKWVTRKFNDNLIPTREEDKNIYKTLSTNAKLKLNINIIEGLDISSDLSFGFKSNQTEVYNSQNTVKGIDTYGNPVGALNKTASTYVTIENVNKISYDRNFRKHHISAYAGIVLKSQVNKSLGASVRDFANDRLQEIQYGDKSTLSASSYTSNSRELSYLVRGTYSYDSRYYFAANFRRDGNSSFGKYARWSNFWSVGTSWNIHKENFFHSSLIKMLKFKFSYGYTGNSRIDTSAATGTYVISPSYSYGSISSGAVLSTVPNPGLTWETTEKINTGIRIELKDIMDAEVEFFNETTFNMLNKIYVSRSIAADRVYANMGSMRNRGIDLDLTFYNFNRREFRWTTKLNISHQNNRILSLNEGMTTSFGTYVYQEGAEKGAMYLVRWAGVDPSDGSPMWYDRNGNITKSYSDNNRVVLKDKRVSPMLYGGLNNILSYRNWTLAFNITYSIGGWGAPTYLNRFLSDGYDITGGNQAVEVYYDRWKTPGQAAAVPKVSQVSTKSGMYSTRQLYNKTYFDLSSASLTYDLPQQAVSKMKIKGMSISLIGNNLYFLTPDQKRDRNSYKTYSSGYPRIRSFSLSINCQF